MSGSVALVTGGSRGIGAATAKELARRGWHVIVNYVRSAELADSVVAGIQAEGGSARAVRADVLDPGQVAEMVDTVVADHGSVDVLVCNANAAQPPFVPLESLPWKDFHDKVSDELAAAFHITQRVLPIMRERRAGRIVYVSSTQADSAVSIGAAHSTAKSALNTFSRHVANEAASFGIAVNTVSPGAVRTDASTRMITAQRAEFISGKSILGRVTEPEDVAGVIALLADDATRAVTGALIRVDGGLGVLVGGPSTAA
jgi:3-oxoacyl-[acyl-carrier protein] reductase